MKRMLCLILAICPPLVGQPQFSFQARGRTYTVEVDPFSTPSNPGFQWEGHWLYEASVILPSPQTNGQYYLLFASTINPNSPNTAQAMYLVTSNDLLTFSTPQQLLTLPAPGPPCDMIDTRPVWDGSQWHVYLQAATYCPTGNPGYIIEATGQSLTGLQWVMSGSSVAPIVSSANPTSGTGIGELLQFFYTLPHRGPTTRPFMGVYNDWSFSTPDLTRLCPNCGDGSTNAFTVLSDNGNNMYYWYYREVPSFLAQSGFLEYYPDALLAGSTDEASLGAPGIGFHGAGACMNFAQVGQGLGFWNDLVQFDGPTNTQRAVQAGFYVNGTFQSAVGGLITYIRLARDPNGYIPATQQGGNNMWTTYIVYNSSSIVNGQACIGPDQYGNYPPPTIQATFENTNPPSRFSFSKVTITESGSRTVATPPMAITPPAGSVQAGVPVTFTAVYSDPGGYQYIKFADLLINNVLDGRHACYLTSSPYNANLNLVADDGSNYTSTEPTPPGSINNPLGTLSNSQCTVNGASPAISEDGNTLTLNLSITFSSSFVGVVPGNAGNLLIYMADQGSQNVPWTPMGVVKLSPSSPIYPNSSSLTPATSSAQTQQFTASWQDQSSYLNITAAQILVNASLDGAHACYVAFQPSGANSGTVLLVDDAGDAGGPFQSLALPGSGTVSNSQCSISGAGSSVSASGNTLSLMLSITASASFQGTRVVWTAAQTGSGGNTGWQPMGVWNVP